MRYPDKQPTYTLKISVCIKYIGYAVYLPLGTIFTFAKSIDQHKQLQYYVCVWISVGFLFLNNIYLSAVLKYET